LPGSASLQTSRQGSAHALGLLRQDVTVISKTTSATRARCMAATFSATLTCSRTIQLSVAAGESVGQHDSGGQRFLGSPRSHAGCEEGYGPAEIAAPSAFASRLRQSREQG